MAAHASEKTGEKYTLAGMLGARQRSWDALEKIRSGFEPGMLESEATELAETVLRDAGCSRKWHRSWIRFGENTLLSYGKPSQPGIRLRENDIFFLDLGPVWEGFEGDVGAAFSVGSDPEMIRCAEDVRKIYEITKQRWRNDRLNGADLYEVAEKAATDRGWVLSLTGASGHRLSDFPHALYHKGSVVKLPIVPSSGLWVLEIQIRHPSRAFGAFYEDLLVD
jgi:Xaa-Pro aminopeptidase